MNNEGNLLRYEYLPVHWWGRQAFSKKVHKISTKGLQYRENE